MYYVYLIESLSADGERYVGMTTDLKQRLGEHNQGKSSHTTKFSPWKLTRFRQKAPLVIDTRNSLTATVSVL